MDGCDVLVVGAGLAGLECAQGMARRGLRVHLADRRTRLDRGARTTGIFVRRTLEDFVVPEDCLGPAVDRVVLYSPSLRPMALTGAPGEFRVGRMGRLYARRLGDCLRAGVLWRPGTRLSGLFPCRGGSLATLEKNGRREQILARFVVGADGAGSSVSRHLGLEGNRRFIVGLEEVHVGASTGEPAFHCFLDPDVAPGYIAWVVDDGEEVHIGVGGHAARFEPLKALEKFKSRLPHELSPAGPPSERRGGRIPAGGVLRRIACPRGLLVGDAAGAVSPLTAGGLDACFRLSAYAAQVAGDYLESGNASALAPYSGRRFRGRFASRLLMRRLYEWLGCRPLLEVSHALLCLPPGRALARHVFFGRGSFPLPAPAPALSSPC